MLALSPRPVSRPIDCALPIVSIRPPDCSVKSRPDCTATRLPLWIKPPRMMFPVKGLLLVSETRSLAAMVPVEAMVEPVMLTRSLDSSVPALAIEIPRLVVMDSAPADCTKPLRMKSLGERAATAGKSVRMPKESVPPAATVPAILDSPLCMLMLPVLDWSNPPGLISKVPAMDKSIFLPAITVPSMPSDLRAASVALVVKRMLSPADTRPPTDKLPPVAAIVRPATTAPLTLMSRLPILAKMMSRPASIRPPIKPMPVKRAVTSLAPEISPSTERLPIPSRLIDWPAIIRPAVPTPKLALVRELAVMSPPADTRPLIAALLIALIATLVVATMSPRDCSDPPPSVIALASTRPLLSISNVPAPLSVTPAFDTILPLSVSASVAIRLIA